MWCRGRRNWRWTRSHDGRLTGRLPVNAGYACDECRGSQPYNRRSRPHGAGPSFDQVYWH